MSAQKLFGEIKRHQMSRYQFNIIIIQFTQKKQTIAKLSLPSCKLCLFGGEDCDVSF